MHQYGVLRDDKLSLSQSLPNDMRLSGTDFSNSGFSMRIKNFFMESIQSSGDSRPILPQEIAEYESNLMSPSIFFKPRDAVHVKNADEFDRVLNSKFDVFNVYIEKNPDEILNPEQFIEGKVFGEMILEQLK